MAEESKEIAKLKALQQAYNKTFKTLEGILVLEDLKKVCFYNGTTIDQLPHVMGSKEGMRSVVLHILTRMNMQAFITRKELENEEGQP